jgi:hypothetical protein
MRTWHRFSLSVLLAVLSAGPAFGQSPYVGAALVGDVLRSTHSETTVGRDVPAGGESIGFALRAGVPLGSSWGVELEFTRPGEIETDFGGTPIPLASRAETLTWSSGLPANVTQLLPQIFPQPVFYRLRSTQRHSTLSTTAWLKQDVSQRIALVYLAGMGFYRATYESESRFEILPAGILPPGITAPLIFPTATKTVSYGVRPLAGFEAHIGLTDQVAIVPGIRLHGLENAWLVRPAIGIEFQF